MLMFLKTSKSMIETNEDFFSKHDHVAKYKNCEQANICNGCNRIKLYLYL